MGGPWKSLIEKLSWILKGLWGWSGKRKGRKREWIFFNTYSSVKRPSLFSGGLWGARCPAGCWQNDLSLENAAMESFNKKERSDRESSRNRGEALKICLP